MLNSVSLLWYLFYSISENIKKTALAGQLFMSESQLTESVQNSVQDARYNPEYGMRLMVRYWGFSQEVRQLNSYLSKIRTDLYLHADKLRDRGQVLTAVSLKESYLGLDKPSKMLLEIFQEHNDQVDSLVGRDFAEGTAERYRTTKSHLSEYLQRELGKSTACGPCLHFRVRILLKDQKKM
tara:strand:- start:4345 stop:4887 length:543 start_codon:yes stop_codon:yes gene_type:complete